MTIDEIIKAAGGPSAIAAASKDGRKPISIWAIHKWRTNGIHNDHWSLLMRLAPSLTVEILFEANERLTAKPRPSHRASARFAAA